jgi:subtilisin family serine protease
VGASSTQGTVDPTDDVVAGYSSRGPTRVDYLAKPDILAPGTGTVSLSDPLSTFYDTKHDFLVAGSVSTANLPYLSLSGTSMASPAVAGVVALMLEANPSLTPNLVKAILQYSAHFDPTYNVLTQGAGFANAKGAIELARFFATARPGERYPVSPTWSRQLIWGSHRIGSGYIVPDANAWQSDVVWGAAFDSLGDNVVWGSDCGSGCDNVVWGSNSVDNVVWGSSVDQFDNVVWGSNSSDNVVWGSDCGGADCDNIVWGSSGPDNVVWGSSVVPEDNVVWGSTGIDLDNIVWGSGSDLDNVVWGSSAVDNIVWDSEIPALPVSGLAPAATIPAPPVSNPGHTTETAGRAGT